MPTNTPTNKKNDGCDKHNHPDCMECFYTTKAEEPKNIVGFCECGLMIKTAKGNKEEDGFKCFCGRPITSPK